MGRRGGSFKFLKELPCRILVWGRMAGGEGLGKCKAFAAPFKPANGPHTHRPHRPHCLPSAPGHLTDAQARPPPTQFTRQVGGVESAGRPRGDCSSGWPGTRQQTAEPAGV
eukprot:GHVT01027947.1.p1 GENE.GHVT01027947.1~~GHVT01027947.1.p1  ORF type:complete len:111 (-),score=14.74 GHVT01027947.1:64-396(-)